MRASLTKSSPVGIGFEHHRVDERHACLQLAREGFPHISRPFHAQSVPPTHRRWPRPPCQGSLHRLLHPEQDRPHGFTGPFVPYHPSPRCRDFRPSDGRNGLAGRPVDLSPSWTSCKGRLVLKYGPGKIESHDRGEYSAGMEINRSVPLPAFQSHPRRPCSLYSTSRRLQAIPDPSGFNHTRKPPVPDSIWRYHPYPSQKPIAEAVLCF